MTSKEIKDWFVSRGLLWSNVLDEAILEVGAECVEDLKVVPEDMFLSWFPGAKFIQKEKAKVAWRELTSELINLKKTAKGPSLQLDEDSAKLECKDKNRHIMRESNDKINKKHELKKKFLFSVTKTAEQRKAERLKRRDDAKMRREQQIILIDVPGNDGTTLDDAALETESSPKKTCGPSTSFLALPHSDWTVGRCHLAKELDTPADKDEKTCWNEKILPNVSADFDYEDPEGLYAVLGNGCNITTSDNAIKDAFNLRKQEYHAIALINHPDKTSNTEKIKKFNNAKSRYEFQNVAFERLSKVESDGTHLQRMMYDKSGQELRRKFKAAFSLRFPNITYSERVNQIAADKKEKEIYAKGRETRENMQHLSALEKVVLSFNSIPGTMQTNLFRVNVVNALKIHTQAEVGRYIRINAFNPNVYPFDGNASKDKKYLCIQQIIHRVSKTHREGKLDDIHDNSSALKSKSVNPKARGRKVTNARKAMEDEILSWCKEMWDDLKPVTRYLVFHKVMTMYPTFEGGIGSDGFFDRMKNWYYHGFKHRKKLSIRKISSIGQKLPKDWQSKHRCIISRVASSQMPKQLCDGSFRPPVNDDDCANSDHVPMYIEMHGNYTLGFKHVHERRMIKTACKEKDRITVQLTGMKSGRKIKPFVIVKAAPCPVGKNHGGKNTVSYEIYHRLPDRWGNHYPPAEECYVTCATTANSSGIKTLEYIEKVFKPAVGAIDGTFPRPVALLVDDFRGHSHEKVKEVTGDLPLLDWHIMPGGITPKAQPLDVLVNKVFKGHFRDIFQSWSLCAPCNEKTGQPLAPSRQLLCQWVVQAWSKVPEELMRKAWVVCGYRSMKDLDRECDNSAVVMYDQEGLKSVVEKAAGADALTIFNDPENEAEEFSDEEDEMPWVREYEDLISDV